MFGTQEVVIPETVRQELISKVTQLLEAENHQLRKVQSEIRGALSRKNRTIGWKDQEVEYCRRVELYTIALTVLQTGKFNPPAGSNLPQVILREKLLDKSLSFVRGAYQKVVDIQDEIKGILKVWNI